MKQLVIVGAGGHARSVVDSIEAQGRFAIHGFVAPDESYSYRGYRTVASDDDLEKILQAGVNHACMGIGYLGGEDIRIPLYSIMLDKGFIFPSIVDPTATVASDASIADGAFIGKRSVVNSASMIGKLAIVNSASVVEHDCRIGAGVHVSVGAVVCGGVSIGAGAFIGAGATVIQGITIGKGAVVGAGSTILRDVPEGERALGLYA